MKLKLAELISRIFDPIVIIPVLIGFAFVSAYPNNNHLGFLILVAVNNVLVPGLILLALVKTGKITSGWDVRLRSERVPLIGLIILFHLIPVILAWHLSLNPIAEYLTAFWILTLAIGVITSVWKVSIHAGVNSLMALLVIIELGWVYSWVYLFVALVIWARVVGKYHLLSQAIVGALLPILIVPPVLYFFG